MITADEESVKNQLFNGFSTILGSTICAAACEMPVSSGSSDDGTKFALKPPDTPANAAAMPARSSPPTKSTPAAFAAFQYAGVSGLPYRRT